MKRVKILALAALLALSGCAQLPTSGQVQAAAPKAVQQNLVGWVAQGPTRDANPVQIVQGFLRACAAGNSDDFTVARSFLGGLTARQWRPEKQVQIYSASSNLSISQAKDGTVTVKADQAALLDATGRYQATQKGASISADFSLARGRDGQWRITNLDDGIILASTAFDTSYQASTLYFLSTSLGGLVPDQRWYPRRKLLPSIISGLLAGPPETLKGAATTAFPAGTSYTGVGVEVTNAVATVPLNFPSKINDSLTRSLMYWQLESTLVGVPGISEVSIVDGAEGTAVERGVVSSPPGGDVEVPIMVHEGTVMERVDEKFRTLVPENLLRGMNLRHPAATQGSLYTVFLDGDKRVLGYDGGKITTLLEGSNFLPPQVDSTGWIWTASGRNPGIFTILRSDGTRLQLTDTFLANQQLIRFVVSPDGARLAALVEREGTSRVAIAAITRDTVGRPTGLSDFSILPLEYTTLSTLTWVGGTKLAILAQATDRVVIVLAPLGGPSDTLQGIKGMTELASPADDRYLLAATVDKDLYLRNGRNWRKIHSDVLDPIYPT